MTLILNTLTRATRLVIPRGHTPRIGDFYADEDGRYVWVVTRTGVKEDWV